MFCLLLRSILRYMLMSSNLGPAISEWDHIFERIVAVCLGEYCTKLIQHTQANNSPWVLGVVRLGGFTRLRRFSGLQGFGNLPWFIWFKGLMTVEYIKLICEKMELIDFSIRRYGCYYADNVELYSHSVPGNVIESVINKSEAVNWKHYNLHDSIHPNEETWNVVPRLVSSVAWFQTSGVKGKE